MSVTLPAELHADYRADAEAVLGALGEAYPQVAVPEVRVFSSEGDRSLGRALDGVIELNAYWFSRPREFFQRGVVRSREHTPQDAPRWHGGIGGEDGEFARFLTHEFGHLLYDATEGSEAFSEAGHAAALEDPRIAASGYALVAEDALEWWAETFAGLRYGSASPQVALMARFLEERR